MVKKDTRSCMESEWKSGKMEDWRVRIWYVVLLKTFYSLRDRVFSLFSESKKN